MRWALVDANSVIQNLIEYDPALPHGPYTPPDGLTLQEVNDWLVAGNNTGDPVSVPIVNPAVLIGQAKYALIQSDDTAIRCLKAGVAFPAEWLAYVAALRTIAAGGPGPLPDKPAYPAGT